MRRSGPLYLSDEFLLREYEEAERDMALSPLQRQAAATRAKVLREKIEKSKTTPS